MERYVHRGIAWQRTAQDRVQWRTGGKAFLLQWSKIGQTERRRARALFTVNGSHTSHKLFSGKMIEL